MLIFNFLRTRLNCGLILLSVSFWVVSCSSSNETSKESFDPDEYHDPYGTDVKMDQNAKDIGQNGDETFFFDLFEYAKIKGGYDALLNNIQYPPEARENNIEGKVVSRLYIDEDGRVRKIITLKSPADPLSRAAKEAILQSRFKPAKRNGKTVKSILQLPIYFTLP